MLTDREYEDLKEELTSLMVQEELSDEDDTRAFEIIVTLYK